MGRTHQEIIADLVRQELDLYGFDNVVVYQGQLPDRSAELAVAVQVRDGDPPDLIQYDFPAITITARSIEPKVAELIAELLHYRLHRRDYLLDVASGRRLWSIMSAGSPQQLPDLKKRPRFEWVASFRSMISREE
jgi:hypothetical protein